MALQRPAGQRRPALLKLGAIVLALALAGCESLLPRGAPAPTEAPPPQTRDDGPIRQGLPDDERHRVALLVPTSGSNANVGQSIANAANMAILDTGDARLRITTYDTAGTGGTAAAANRALEDGSQLFLGPLLSENVREIAPMARGAGVPIVSFSNDTSIAGEGTYVMGFTPAQSIQRVTSYAYQEGSRRFAALVPEGLYGQRASAAYADAVRQAGGTLVATRSYERSSRSLQRAVTQLRGEGEFDTLLIADSGATARQAVEYLHAIGEENVRILGTELWNNQPNLTQYEELHGAVFASVSDSTFQTLGRRYRSRFNSSPYRLSSLGYDAALLLVRIAENWDPGEPFPVNALRDPGGFSGVDGAFRFLPSGIAQRALEVQRIDASGFTVVSPAPTGFDD